MSRKPPCSFPSPPIIQTYLLHFPDGLVLCTWFSPCLLGQSEVLDLSFLSAEVQSVLSKQMSVVWAGLKMRRGGKKAFCIFWVLKKRLFSTKMFHSRDNIFLLCSPELKKGPKGTRHIMSNLTRQCLTGLKLLNLPNWWELEFTG